MLLKYSCTVVTVIKPFDDDCLRRITTTKKPLLPTDSNLGSSSIEVPSLTVIAIAHGFAIMVLVYTVGEISGGRLIFSFVNPINLKLIQNYLNQDLIINCRSH